MNSNLILLLFSLLSGIDCVAQQNLRRAFQPPNVVNKIPYGANAEAGHYVKSNDANIYMKCMARDNP